MRTSIVLVFIIPNISIALSCYARKTARGARLAFVHVEGGGERSRWLTEGKDVVVAPERDHSAHRLV